MGKINSIGKKLTSKSSLILNLGFEFNLMLTKELIELYEKQITNFEYLTFGQIIIIKESERLIPALSLIPPTKDEPKLIGYNIEDDILFTLDHTKLHKVVLNKTYLDYALVIFNKKIKDELKNFLFYIYDENFYVKEGNRCIE